MKKWQENLFYQLKVGLDRGTVDGETILSKAMLEGFFIETYADLVKLSETDMSTAVSIARSIVGRSSETVITKRRLLAAIRYSLHNTDLRNRMPMHDKTYISALVYKRLSCILTLSKYGKIMSNPVALLFCEEWRMHKAIFIARSQDIPSIMYGRKVKCQYISEYLVPAIQIDSVFIEDYHPLIWHLLEEGTLIDYAILFKIPLSTYGKQFSTQGTD